MNTRFILLFCFAFLHQLSISWGDSYEDNTTTLEISMSEFGNSFLNNLSEKYPDAFKENITNANLSAEKEKIRQLELKYGNIDDETNAIEMENIINIVNDDGNITKNENNNDSFSPDEYKDYVHRVKKHAKKIGQRKLKLLAYEIINRLNPTFYSNSIILNASQEYITELEEYFDSIHKKKVKNEIDREFLILDSIESSNKLFSIRCQKLYFKIASSINKPSVSNVDAMIISKIIHNAVIDQKRDGLKYICKKKYVCRSFPAFSDHLAKFMKNLLNLSDNKFDVAIKTIRQLVEQNAGFFKSLLNDDMALTISSELESIVGNIPEISEFMSIVRGMLVQKYKMYHNIEIELQNSTKASRILIDLIDKTFATIGDTYIKPKFDMIQNAINAWANDKKRDINKNLKTFIIELFQVMKKSWNKDVREEIKVLVDIIMKYNSKNNELADELMTQGSRFVRGETILYSDNDES